MTLLQGGVSEEGVNTCPLYLRMDGASIFRPLIDPYF